MTQVSVLAHALRRLALACALLLPAAVLADDYADVNQLLRSGKYAEALAKADQYIAAKPRDPQMRFLKGVVQTQAGRTADAIATFTQLTEEYPELPEPYNNLAVIYAGQGQYEKARAALEQSIRTHPSYATAYENLGDVYAKLASQAYGKALQLDASNTGAQNKLSLVRELVGEPKPATVAKAEPKAEPRPEIKAEPKPEIKPEPKVEAKAEPKPEAKPAAADPAEVLKAVQAWAQAWSKKDADGYLAHYAPSFDPPGSQSRADWEKERRERIQAPKSISVAVGSPKVTMQGSNEAVVRFRQTYRSDRLKTSSRKTLDMVKTDKGWQIRKEQSGK